MRLSRLARVAVTNEQGRVLLLRRSENDKRRAGQWDLPGGKVEPGESNAEGGSRELYEESGIKILPHVLELFLSERGEVTYEDTNETVDVARVYYRARLDATPQVIESHEHSDHYWATPAEAIEMIEYDRLKNVVEYMVNQHLFDEAISA